MILVSHLSFSAESCLFLSHHRVTQLSVYPQARDGLFSDKDNPLQVMQRLQQAYSYAETIINILEIGNRRV